VSAVRTVGMSRRHRRRQYSNAAKRSQCPAAATRRPSPSGVRRQRLSGAQAAYQTDMREQNRTLVKRTSGEQAVVQNAEWSP
jgi:hypothetical protein